MGRIKNSNNTTNDSYNDNNMKTFQVIDKIFYVLYKKISSDLPISKQKSFDKGVKEIVNQCCNNINDNSKINIPDDNLNDVTFAINTIAKVVKRNRRQAVKSLNQSEYIVDFLRHDDILKLIETFEGIPECTNDNINNILITIKTTIDVGVEASNVELHEKYGMIQR